MNYLKGITAWLGTMEKGARLRIAAAVVLLLMVAIVLSAVNDRIARLAKKRIVREAEIAEMLQLKLRYQEALASSQLIANRLSATRPDDSPAKIFEEIGIKGKNSQIKPLKGEERAGYIEDAAEIKVDALSANEAVNLIYRLEKGSKPLAIRKAAIKTRFDDPSRLDLTLTVALLKSAPAVGK